jgi:uncharacterized protein
MKEEKVTFPAGEILLEGLYAEARGPRGAVVSHPHPQMGGAMWNNVVEALVFAFHGNGVSTLRFNFRGVGRSEGMYDNGGKEQDDVRGALEFVAAQGKSNLILAGYSFGAWVNARAVSREIVRDELVLVSPPLSMMKFDAASLVGKVGLTICGDQDQFCSLETLRPWTDATGCRLEIIVGADHFYFGKEGALVDAINTYCAM